MHDLRAGTTPNDAARILNAFFCAVERQTEEREYDDPGMLAARYVAWRAMEYAREEPLDFFSVRVVTPEAGARRRPMRRGTTLHRDFARNRIPKSENGSLASG